MICFLLFLEVVNYELYAKHINVGSFYKFIYVLIDFFHISVIGFIFFLLINLECNIFKLILLDSLYLCIVLLFFIFKRCFLSIIENRVLGVDENYSSISLYTRLNHFFDMNVIYKPELGNNILNWMEGNRIIASLIIFLNVFCLFKIYKKNKKKIKLF
jgi:hypothetical protein